MDSNLILECFAGTLHTDPVLRNQAESKLKELSLTPGFLGACLDIIDNSSSPIQAKKAAAVYFKNRVVKYWSLKDSNFKIDHDEKPIIKERILPVIINCDYNIKQQLIPVLRLLIALEFDTWTGLLDQTGQLLQLDNLEDYLYTGMLCFAEIARKYKWMDNHDRKTQLYPIINQAFPHLLNVGNFIINNEMTELRAEILKLILKLYKFVTYYDLPEPLRSREAIFTWGEFHGAVINMKPPAYVVNSTALEQEKLFLQIAKCYKWAIANIYRLFIRYATSNNLTKKFVYKDFHELFLNEFIPHFITQFLTIIEEFCQGKRWLSTTSIYQLLEFLSHCIVEKSTWSLIKPYFETLITHLVYPIICPDDASLEIFDEDPQEYINLHFDQTSEYNSPENAALGFIETALYKKTKSTLPPVSNFVYQQLSELQQQPQETLEVAKKKEGLLRILGTISGRIPKDETVEPILAALVLPCLTSKFEFLQARAINVVSEFSEVPFANQETLSAIIHGVLRNFDNSDASLPVLFESALSIQAFMVMDEFKLVLSNVILPTMTKLLDLSNEIDSDAISVVMQDCVENFSEQLQPFGVDLMSKLVQQFMKLAHEINEASQVDVDDFDGNFDDQGDKVMAALGFINTMITVLLSFENSREICIKLEEIFSEVIVYVLRNNLDDFLAEIGELMENSTFLLRSISPIMWENFKLLYASFEQDTALMYFEELLPCLKNFLIYGKDELKGNPQLTELFYKIFLLVSEGASEDVGYSDLVQSFEYAQTFILSLEEQSNKYIPSFIECVAAHYQSGDKKVIKSAFVVNSNNVIIASLIYDTTNVIALLQQSGHLMPFLNKWLEIMPTLERVYDLKLSTLACINIIKLDLDQQILTNISKSLVTLLRKLPLAVQTLEKKRKDYGELSGVDNYQLEGEWDDEETTDVLGGGGDGDDEEEEVEQGFVNAEDLNLRKSGGFFDIKEDEVYEDPLASTPLDTINIFLVAKQFIQDFQANSAEKFNLAFGHLSEEEQKVLIDIMNV
ncbi:Nonsense-mediated mRNA decay protein 5 [Candida viswanathii]|uniref:Nonsense-mediated mRNA decay protein 5 n=1 Tax=Candida viswanathii TaxID=5486 RepID=A0A367Y2K4_9ASCO|nr:Nonsense-mediated mRNA decay protein 5 [Candida viswanathii]